MMTNLRKGFRSKGDDTTLTRFVKRNPKERPSGKPTQGWLKGTRFKGSVVGTTIFPKTVKPVHELKHVLVSGINNAKIGRDVRKGKLFRGYWIYTLSLEERATCPRSCHHWDTCYGNNMPFAKRVSHADQPALQEAIREEVIDHLLKCLRKNSPRKGVLLRLHALGDFFNPSYVQFWDSMLDEFPALACFGYTAWLPDTDIGSEIARVKEKHGRRFAIRWSNGGMKDDCAISISPVQKCPPNAFVCPEQTGQTAVCATCAACWETSKNVAFMDH